MKQNRIVILESELPDAFDRSEIGDDFDEDIYIIPTELDAGSDPFIDELYANDDRTEREFDPLQVDSICNEIEEGTGDLFPRDVASATETSNNIREIFTAGFPGHPVTSPSPPISTDIFGFYLPWHRYNEDIWGIYLIAEGVDTLGREFYAVGKGYLSPAECNRLARAFIFYHEAYHNIVETFSARLEVAHRKPCYLAGALALHKTGFGRGSVIDLHEEGMADAYALRKVGSTSFGYIKSKILKKSKRKIALSTMKTHMVKTSMPPYSFSKNVLTPGKFSIAQKLFQELILRDSILGIAHSDPNLWSVSPYSMTPTLRRNGFFSYITPKSSPIALRAKLAVHYLDRRKFLKQLVKKTGGMVPSGKRRGRHPSKFQIGNLKIPIPSHGNVLKPGTAGSILKQAGVEMKLEDFMNTKF